MLTRSRLPSRLELAALAALALAAVGGFLAFATYPSYDSLYALVWARDLLDFGVRPGFEDYRAPTQHPLLLPVGLLLAPLGDAGARLFVLVCVGAFVALVAAVYRLGGVAAGVLGALLAAALIGSRLNLALLASIGFLDLPYCALVAWAAVLELDRPRRGGTVWVLLTLAGLLRPEAWVLLGLYALRVGWRAPWAGRVRALALAAVAPVLWSLTDLAVTGDPLFSLLHTDGLALELQRQRPLETLPWLMVRLLAEILKWPLLAASVVGLALALARRERRLWPLAALVPVTCATYLVIASGGLPTVYRYLLVAAIALTVFAAYGLAGWTRLAPGRPGRRAWAVASAALVVAGAGWTVAHTSPAKVTAELRERERIRADLRALVGAPAVRAALRCGPLTVPNHKLLPEVRWLLDGRPPSAVRARSDRSRPAPRGGVAIIVERRFERRPALDVFEVPADRGARLQIPPPGFRPLAGNRTFAAWGACPERVPPARALPVGAAAGGAPGGGGGGA